MALIEKLKPAFWNIRPRSPEASKYLFNYVGIWRLSVALSSVVVLVPLVFITVVSYSVMARDLAINAIKAGVSGTQVDRIARDHIDQNGYAGKFGHSLGHGTGLAVHENPRLSPIKDDQLEAGMIVTVEPGIYLPGWGGIRMENQVVVRQNSAQVLNDPTPFDPRIEV